MTKNTAADHAAVARRLAGHASDLGHAAIVEAILAVAATIREADADALAQAYDLGRHDAAATIADGLTRTNPYRQEPTA